MKHQENVSALIADLEVEFGPVTREEVEREMSRMEEIGMEAYLEELLSWEEKS